MSKSCQVVYGNIGLDVLSLCKNNEVVSIFVLLVECTLVLEKLNMLRLLFIFLNSFSFLIFLCKHFAFQCFFGLDFSTRSKQSRDIIDWYVVLIRTTNVIGPSYFVTLLCVSWNYDPFLGIKILANDILQ